MALSALRERFYCARPAMLGAATLLSVGLFACDVAQASFRETVASGM